VLFFSFCASCVFFVCILKGSLEYGVDEDDEEDGPGINWMPRKRNKELQIVDTPNSTTASSRGLDILALLVSIYGSSDLFIVEYRSLLADKLLSNLRYFTEQEVANLELLKIRFFHYFIFLFLF
jgi:anaphase-promoting complex subunit 2